ncbi:MAG: hypothetical protein IJ131_11520 [Eggerthellaceae bacterium]|nr:hypothetical protein [Eggerthellaceae bacterium]
MMNCWQQRGCDEEWQSRCPHNTPGERCPADCLNTHCTRPTYEAVSALDALMNPNIDRSAAVKESCMFCRFFLEHGPLLAE